MRLTVVPPIDEVTEGGLREAVRRVGVEPPGNVLTRAPWWRAGLDDAVERNDRDDYALSPRSTRGATRA